MTDIKDSALVVLQNNQALTTSRVVAEKFDKTHKHVLESINNLKDQLSTAEFSALFSESSYIALNGKTNPQYLMNRDGFSLLAMGFTGTKALQFKLKFIAAFNRMEAQLQQQVTKAMSPLDILEQQVQIMRRLENQANQNTADIKKLRDAHNGMSLRHEMVDIKQQDQLDNHEERINENTADIKEIKEVIGDKGPAEEVKTLISEIVAFTADTDKPYSYQEAYKLFYDTLKQSTGIRICTRVDNLKKRMEAKGWSKTKVNKISGLDAITADPMIWQRVRDVVDILKGYLDEAKNG